MGLEFNTIENSWINFSEFAPHHERLKSLNEIVRSTLWGNQNIDKHIRILLIEDSKEDARLITKKLRQSNQLRNSLYLAKNLFRAKDLIRRMRFDLILMGLDLPDEASLKAYKQLARESRETPTIVVGKTHDPQTAQMMIEAGAKAYISKLLLKSRGKSSFIESLRKKVSQMRRV